jgi:hypothetical protein
MDAMYGLALAVASSTPMHVVSTRMAVRASPLGFSANSVTRPLASIFITPNDDASFSAHGRAAMVMAAPESRCFWTKAR